MVDMKIATVKDMHAFAATIAKGSIPGRVIELVGDVGAGKTTFMQGFVAALGADDEVQSPSFTISRTYDTKSGFRVMHYDFYRLTDAGILLHEVQEMLEDEKTIIAIEWASSVAMQLPTPRLRITLQPEEDEARTVVVEEVA